MAARIRTLADAVRELTAEIRSVRESAPALDLSRLDGEARKAADRVAAALEHFTIQLGVTNNRLQQLANRPIVGFLGGGAEAELQRLVAATDKLRDEVRGVRDVLHR